MEPFTFSNAPYGKRKSFQDIDARMPKWIFDGPDLNFRGVIFYESLAVDAIIALKHLRSLRWDFTWRDVQYVWGKMNKNKISLPRPEAKRFCKKIKSWIEAFGSEESLSFLDKRKEAISTLLIMLDKAVQSSRQFPDNASRDEWRTHSPEWTMEELNKFWKSIKDIEVAVEEARGFLHNVTGGLFASQKSFFKTGSYSLKSNRLDRAEDTKRANDSLLIYLAKQLGTFHQSLVALKTAN
ncbi:hypothetical protein ACHAXS_002566 [Conticribra weissflogii]